MISGYVLGGGHGSRIGADKARLPGRDHWPLAIGVAIAMRRAGVARVIVVRHDPELDPWPTPDGDLLGVQLDGPGPRHPLRGLAAALTDAASRGEAFALVAPADLRAPDPAVFLALLAQAPAIATDVFDEPLLGVYATSEAARAVALADAQAPAWCLATGLARVRAPAADVDWPEQVNDPVGGLMARLSWLSPAAAARVASGERARLAARGVVLRRG